MSFAPTTSTSLRGIELCVGVKLCTDELFTTVCFTRFRCTFHVFHQDVAKGSRVAYIAMATHACFKCMFHMFQLFQTYVANLCSKGFSSFGRMFHVFHLDVAIIIEVCFKSILHICCNDRMNVAETRC
jgi:hypothetical protein